MNEHEFKEKKGDEKDQIDFREEYKKRPTNEMA